MKEGNHWEDVLEVAGLKKAHCVICKDDGRVLVYTDIVQKDTITKIKYVSECMVNTETNHWKNYRRETGWL